MLIHSSILLPVNDMKYLLILLLLGCKTVVPDHVPSCPWIGVSYVDKPIMGAVFYRDWYVIDWCKFDGKDKGLWEYRQTLMVGDTTITPPRKVIRKGDLQGYKN